MGTGFPSTAEYPSQPMARNKDDRRDVAECRGRPATGPPYLAERDGAWVEVSWPRHRGVSTTSPTGCSRSAYAGAKRSGSSRPTNARVVPVRLRARPDRGDRRPRLRRTARRTTLRTCSATPRRSACSSRTTTSSPRSDRCARSCPPSATCITFAGLAELEAAGRDHAAAHPTALADAEAQVGEDDLFTYIYTSGTTGPRRACMILHRNYYEMATVVDKMEKSFVGPEDTLLLYLPLAHNYGRLIHLQAIHVGYTLAFCRDPLKSARRCSPSAPPRSRACRACTRRFTPPSSPVGRRARREGATRPMGDRGRARVSRRRQAGEPIPRSLALRHRIADRLVYSKIKARMGGRLRLANSGGAPLSREVMELFAAFDVPIYEGYGLTECTCACSVNRPGRLQVRNGRQGPPGHRGEAGGGRRAGDARRDHLRRLLQGRGGDPRGVRRRRLAPHRRHRRDRRGRLHHDHRPEEGHPRHRRRQEHRAAEPRERPEGLTVRLAGDRARRPAPVRGRAAHARPGGAGEVASGGRRRRRARSSRGSSTR